jgi:Putative peptidoglycan binding domain
MEPLAYLYYSVMTELQQEPDPVALSDGEFSDHCVWSSTVFARCSLLLLPFCIGLFATNPAIAETLQFGDEGLAVRDLQDTLKVKGYFKGESTEFYGYITEEAVIQFQKASGLEADGIVGDVTAKYLKLPPSPRVRGKAKGCDGREISGAGSVANVQSALCNLGYLEFDGAYYSYPSKGDTEASEGRETRRALREFQLDNGLPDHGRRDEKTIATLQQHWEQPAPSETLVSQFFRHASEF